MKNEVQNVEAEPENLKNCQICDFPLQQSESYCHSCGALWCEDNQETKAPIIYIFDPQDYTQSSVIPLLSQ